MDGKSGEQRNERASLKTERCRTMKWGGVEDGGVIQLVNSLFGGKGIEMRS